MPRDPRPYITMADTTPEHPKIEHLSDAAFRLWFNWICWSSRLKKDGRIPATSWTSKGNAKTRAELMAVIPGEVHPLAEDDQMGGVILHDYCQHQRTAEEIEALSAAKSGSGSYGNHKRWHLDRGMPDAECSFCQAA